MVWRYPLASSGSRVQWPWPEYQMESIVLPAAGQPRPGSVVVTVTACGTARGQYTDRKNRFLLQDQLDRCFTHV